MLAYEKLIFTRSDNHLHLINIILEIGNMVLSTFQLLRIAIFFVIGSLHFHPFLSGATMKGWRSILKLSQIFNFRAIPSIASNSRSRGFPSKSTERERSFQYLIIRHGSRPHSSNPTDPRRPSPPSISAENKSPVERLSLRPPLPLPSLDFGFDSTAISGSDAPAWSCANAGTKDAHETPRGNTFIGGNKGRCDGKRRHRVRLLRVVFTLSLSLSVLLAYPCCNPLGWTIMREKPCKYESIGRGTTSSNWIVYWIVRERICFLKLYILLLICVMNMSISCLKLKECEKRTVFILKFFNYTVKLSIDRFDNNWATTMMDGNIRNILARNNITVINDCTCMI